MSKQSKVVELMEKVNGMAAARLDDTDPSFFIEVSPDKLQELRSMFKSLDQVPLFTKNASMNGNDC